MNTLFDYDDQAWVTLFDGEYKKDQFLYHYTDVNKAMKILNSDSLKFSKLCKANDTMESKPKIMLDQIGKVNMKQKTALK